MRKFIRMILLYVVVALAANPKPLETKSVKVVYVIDGAENEEVEAIMPRAALDSILQDVDSVYLAPYGSCLYDNFGDDQLLISFYDKNHDHTKFYGIKGVAQICNRFTDRLDLVFKLKNAHKINALADSLMKKSKLNPKKRR